VLILSSADAFTSDCGAAKPFYCNGSLWQGSHCRHWRPWWVDDWEHKYLWIERRMYNLASVEHFSCISYTPGYLYTWGAGADYQLGQDQPRTTAVRPRSTPAVLSSPTNLRALDTNSRNQAYLMFCNNFGPWIRCAAGQDDSQGGASPAARYFISSSFVFFLVLNLCIWILKLFFLSLIIIASMHPVVKWSILKPSISYWTIPPWWIIQFQSAGITVGNDGHQTGEGEIVKKPGPCVSPSILLFFGWHFADYISPCSSQVRVRQLRRQAHCLCVWVWQGSHAMFRVAFAIFLFSPQFQHFHLQIRVLLRCIHLEAANMAS
jgi:hypothetical protein